MIWRFAGMVALVAAIATAPCAAQVSTGRIDATVVDGTSAVLPGVALDISGPLKQGATTDNLGEAHFLNLPPGTYTVTARLPGFSDYLNKRIGVTTGASVPLKIALSVAGIVRQVQVSNTNPVLDPRRTAVTTNVSSAELRHLPWSGDPWTVLQTIPSVVVDRVNVGGAESGQQATFQAKGAGPGENTWNIDGVAVTDMAALGSTPTYYDLGMLQEMHVSTGGPDVTSQTPGVQVNMVLKSGGNTPSGSARAAFENENLQANNLSRALASTIGGASGQGTRVSEYSDYGFELGGPLVRDRLSAWGAFGKTNIDLITLGGPHDRTELNDASVKANGQVTNAIRANYSFFRGDKQKFGRGVGRTASDESSYNQNGPTTLNKGEADVVLGEKLFLAVRGSHVSTGFTLAARGGTSAQMFVDDGGVIRGSNNTYVTDRPQDALTADANSFRGRHELKFGFGWRRATVESTDAFPGNGIVTFHNGYPDMIARITRPLHLLADGVYFNGYAGDTWSIARATLNLGVRWDRQAASLGTSGVSGSSVLPGLLTAVTAAPNRDVIVWNTLTPRVGITYALSGEHQTLARASYSMFASQLSATQAGSISPIQYAAIDFAAVDDNGNRIADPAEIRFSSPVVGFYGFDPFNPSRTTPINQIGSYAVPLTHELLVGVDRELAPHFAMTAAFTYRYFDHLNWRPRIGVTSSDYTQSGTLSGSAEPIGSFSVPFYKIDPAAVPPGGGRSFEERRGYHQRFAGFEASAVKQLANGWMARLGFSSSSHREYFDGPDAIEDPTPSPANPNIQGGAVVTPAAGSGASTIFMVPPRFQIVANGMYQLPWHLDLAGNWSMRQGYAMPYFRDNVATGDVLSGNKSVLLVDDAGRFRLPRVSSLDARLARVFAIERASLAIDLDVFNLTNAATVLSKQYNLRATGPTGFNQTLEVMNPRIFRIGGRFSF